MRLRKLPHANYLTFILRYRLAIIGFITTVVLMSTFFIDIEFAHQDYKLWINGSRANNELIASKYPAYCVEKIEVTLPTEKWSETDIAKLRDFESRIRALSDVKAVHSLFESKQVYNRNLSPMQQMVQVYSLEDKSNAEVLKLIQNEPERFSRYLQDNKVSFYVMSSHVNDFKSIDTPLSYEIINDIDNEEFSQLILFAILLAMLSTMFAFVFKSFLPTILGIFFIYATGVITVALFQLFSSVAVTHISIIIVAMTISVMDFSYIYYKWHLYQRRFDARFVLYRVVSKTLKPIFWTSVITVVGIGSLVFVQSEILFSLGMNVALSAISGFILSFTLLPALLSFFEQDESQVMIQKSVHFFARQEARYRKQWLKLFLAASFGVFLYAFYQYVSHPVPVASSINNYQIKAVLDRKGFDHDRLMEQRWIELRLKEEFDSIASIQSAYSMIRAIHEQENPGEVFVLKEEDIDSYLFSIDLYGLKESLVEQGALILNIDLKEGANKAEVLRFLQDKGLIFQDRSSLLNLAKIESISTLWYAVFFVFFLIVLIIYGITRLREFAMIAFVVNAIPLVWFFAAIYFFHIALSMEILVAMIVTLALSSDATLHFISYYHDERHKPRSAELALETLFIAVGTPLVMGNIILALTFGALIFVPIETISNIGLYSSLLITLSLLTDMFILPVLFLSNIKANYAIKDYNHSL